MERLDGGKFCAAAPVKCARDRRHQGQPPDAGQLRRRNQGPKVPHRERFLPHDGYHKDYKTGKSAEEILKRHGFRVRPVPNDSIENGIKAARQTLAQTVFDKDKAAPIVDALKRYRRAINSSTNEPGAPLHDDASHGADNYRYIALCAEQMTNEDEVMPVIVPSFDPLDTELGI